MSPLLVAITLLYVQSPTLNEQLVAAAGDNDSSKVQELLKAGADANYVSANSRTPVLLEAFRGPVYNGPYHKIYRDPVVRLLLDHGAKADAIDGFGWCALTLTDRDVTYDLVKYLLDKGADPNRVAMHGDPAIVRFASHDRLDLVKLAVEWGAKVDQEGYFGKTALAEAASTGSLGIVKYLRSKGAKASYRSYAKLTTLHFAAQCDKDNRVMLDYLVAQGLDINARSDYGQTPLHSAAYFGNAANAKWLLAHGAKRKLKDKKGMTALQVAIAYQKQSKQDRSAMIKVLRG